MKTNTSNNNNSSNTAAKKTLSMKSGVRAGVFSVVVGPRQTSNGNGGNGGNGGCGGGGCCCA